jgi:hypothetical protein
MAAEIGRIEGSCPSIRQGWGASIQVAAAPGSSSSSPSINVLPSSYLEVAKRGRPARSPGDQAIGGHGRTRVRFNPVLEELSFEKLLPPCAVGRAHAKKPTSQSGPNPPPILKLMSKSLCCRQAREPTLCSPSNSLSDHIFSMSIRRIACLSPARGSRPPSQKQVLVEEKQV